jgi:hypothetical protein
MSNALTAGAPTRTWPNDKDWLWRQFRGQSLDRCTTPIGGWYGHCPTA